MEQIMDRIKTTSAALAAKRAEIAGIQAQIDRAQGVIDAGIPGQDKIAGLSAQRRTEIGTAFMESRPADVATIDRAITKLEKEAADAKETIAGARVALTMLAPQVTQARAELTPLQAAQDAAITEYADEKDAQAVEMMNMALDGVSVALNHMAAAESVSRRVRPMMQPWRWQHRLHQLQNNRMNVQINSDAIRADLLAELADAGVQGAGIVRVERPAPPVPSQWTEDPVTFTYAAPADAEADLAPPKAADTSAPSVDDDMPVVTITYSVAAGGQAA